MPKLASSCSPVPSRIEDNTAVLPIAIKRRLVNIRASDFLYDGRHSGRPVFLRSGTRSLIWLV